MDEGLLSITSGGCSGGCGCELSKMLITLELHGIFAGLENCTRPLVFTSASGCRASENFDTSSKN